MEANSDRCSIISQIAGKPLLSLSVHFEKRSLMKRKRSSTDAHPQRVQVRCADISLHIVF